VFILCAKMVDNITAVFTEYEERVWGLQKVPTFSHARRMVRSNGAPNRAFSYSSFNDLRPPVRIFRLEF
jgi:hypothetical protein